MGNPAVEVALKGLDAIGIHLPPSAEGLIEMLIDDGEDALTAIPHIVSFIERMGGDAWHTIDEVATGMQKYGPLGYVQRQIDNMIDPHVNTITNIHQQKQTLLTNHRATLQTLKTQVDTLAPGGPPGQQNTYAGSAADTLRTTFYSYHDSMSSHLDLLEQTLAVDQKFFSDIGSVVTNLNSELLILLVIAVILVVAFAVAVVLTGGGAFAALLALLPTIEIGIPAWFGSAAVTAVLSLTAIFLAWELGHQILGIPSPISLPNIPAIHLPNIPTILPNTPTNNGPQSTINEARAHQDDLPLPGKAKGPYVFNPPKGVKDLSQTWDKEAKGFRDANGNIWVWDKLHNDHWDVQHRDGTYTNVRPNGEKGQGDPHHRR
jgi:hypothetical protein